MKKKYFIIIYIILSFCVFSQENDLFITLWDTRLVKSWPKTPINEIDLPLVEDGIYNFLIDWGDNSKNSIKSFDDENKKHKYKEPGIYKVKIKGTIKGWSFKNKR